MTTRVPSLGTLTLEKAWSCQVLYRLLLFFIISKNNKKIELNNHCFMQALRWFSVWFCGCKKWFTILIPQTNTSCRNPIIWWACLHLGELGIFLRWKGIILFSQSFKSWQAVKYSSNIISKIMFLKPCILFFKITHLLKFHYTLYIFQWGNEFFLIVLEGRWLNLLLIK